MSTDADPQATIRSLSAALAEERRQLQTLIDHLPDLIFIKNRESRFLVANKATAHVMQVASPEELIGRCDLDFYAKEMADSYRADELEVLERKLPVVDREERNIDPSGTERWFLTTKAPLFNEAGDVIGIIGIGREFTDRRLSDLALRSENRALAEANRLLVEQVARLREELRRATG